MTNPNRFNALVFVPLNDEKRVSVKLLKYSLPTRITSIQQLLRFFKRVFNFNIRKSLYLKNSNFFVVHDTVSQCYYLCHFLVDLGVIQVEASISSLLVRYDINDVLGRLMYYTTYDSHFLNWDELIKYLFNHYYTGRFNEDLFVRLNAPGFAFNSKDISI